MRRFLWMLATVGLMLVTVASVAQPVGASTASRWKTVQSDGITMSVPATWAIRPFSDESRCRPPKRPSVFLDVPPHIVWPFCPVIPSNPGPRLVSELTIGTSTTFGSRATGHRKVVHGLTVWLRHAGPGDVTGVVPRANASFWLLVRGPNRRRTGFHIIHSLRKADT